jgi:molecular chaperone GrpE
LAPAEGHFVPKSLIGNIIDSLTFAVNFLKMPKKNMDKEAKFNAEENSDVNGNIDINTDESLSGTSHLNEPVSEESELEKVRAELEEQKDKFVRKVAEFDNFKRRSARERMELIQTAGKEVIVDLLDVLDDCDRAQKQIENTDIKEIKDGVLLVFNKLRNTLYARGLRPMETIHEEFDPDLHDAITEIPAPSDDLKGKVLDEIVKGYYLNDKIIRHAKVVVGK